MHSRLQHRDLPTPVLIKRALANYSLQQLEQVEAQLRQGIIAGNLKQQGQAALRKVRHAIARRQLAAVFENHPT
jgi:hypothetical protein